MRACGRVIESMTPRRPELHTLTVADEFARAEKVCDGEAVDVGVRLGDAAWLAVRVGLSVGLGLPDGLSDAEKLRDGVGLPDGEPVVEGERVVEEELLVDDVALWVKLGDTVALWDKLGVVVPEAVAVVDGVEVGDLDMLIVILGVEDADGDEVGLRVSVIEGL